METKRLSLCVVICVLLLSNMSCDVQRFKDNNDGTVTDKRTGLIWLKNANPCDLKNWADAESYCASLESGQAGLIDDSVAGQWRLPTIYELEQIGTNPPTTWDTGCNAGNPCVPWTTPDAPFIDVQSDDFYWSSTSPPDFADYVRVLSMQYGSLATDSKTSFNSNHYVWPVRSGN